MPDDRLKHMAFMADMEKCVMEQTRRFNDPRRKERLARQQGYDEGYEDGWNAATCEQVGIPAITTDTSARIMAIMYVHGGGEEEMVLNQKFVNDVKYIQRRFHIQGGEVPDETFVLTMQHYVKQLEQHIEACKRNNVSDTQIPEWAHKLMRDRYGMKLHG